MPWDKLFPIGCLILLILLVLWFLNYRKAEGFQTRYNMSVYGGDRDSTPAAPSAPATSGAATTAIAASYAVVASIFTCNTAAGEKSVPCPDNRKQMCCSSPNPYIAIRKANGLGPIDLSANLLLPPVKPDTTTEAWKVDTITRDIYNEYQWLQDEGDTADDTPQDPLPPEVPPNFGVALGQFDSPVSNIPWDADNADSLQSDIAWGYISPEASKSIWLKVYTRNLLSNPGNLNGNDQGKFKYHAALIDTDIYDPNAAAAYQVGEFLLMNAVFPAIQEVLSVENIYNRFHKSSHTPATPIKKIEKPVGKPLKAKVGAGKFKAMKKVFSNKFTRWFGKKMAAMSAKFAIKKAALLASLQAAVAAAGLASMGTAVPYAQSVVGMVAGVLDTISNVIMVLTMLIAPVLEQLLEGDGMCPTDYKALDTIIPQPAEMIIANFIPIIGDIVDLFYTYVCFRKPRDEMIAGLIAFATGQFVPAIALFITAAVKDDKDKTPWIVLKSALKGQPYEEDSTLSVFFADQIEPTILGDGTARLPPPLEAFQIQKSNGSIASRSWCNFANPIMMDRMANFYYKYSYANPVYNDDGTIGYEYISGFIGVIASSELSCDVVCVTTKISFDAITGGNMTKSNDSPVYRRFYFIKDIKDPEGYFTVTGCTNVDDCAPEATALSTDKDADYVPSVPKTFEVAEVQKPGFDKHKLVADEISTVVGMGLMMKGGIAGAAAGAVFSDQIYTGSSIVAGQIAASPKKDKIGSFIDIAGCTAETATDDECIPNGKFILRTRNDYYYINRGAVIEQSVGYTPEINFCQGVDGKGVPLTMDQCTDQRSLRAVIAMYEKTYPTSRVKVVRVIEPRAIYGCYYLFDTVSYNPDTNEEGIEYIATEIIGYYTILNQSTCVRTLDIVGPYATADPIFKVPRTIPIPQVLQTPGGPTVKYPTRKPVTDKAGRVTYVPINPREPFVVPPALPPKGTTLGDPKTCPNVTCDKRTVIDRMVVDFNKAHPEDPKNTTANRKIQSVLKAWTSKPDRCDYEVEMLRFDGKKRIVQKETVSMQVKLDEAPGAVPCTFTRVSDGSDRINSGTFIQANTPALSAPDTSGGVLGFKSVTTAIQTIFNNTIKPILMAKPDVQLPAIASEANRSIAGLSELIFNEQILKACPSKSCRDPDVLKAIALQYNADNLPSDEFYVDKNVMGKILKSGVADGSSCDVIFENMRYSYDDVLQPHTSQVSTGMIYRFRLTPTGTGCGTGAYRVKPGDYFDVSDNAIGVRSAETTLFQTPTGQYRPDANIGYTVPQDPPINCSSDATLAAVKAAMPVPTGTTASTYRSVLWNYSRSNNVCEYKIKKDVTTGMGTTKQKTKLDVETFLSVVFSPSPKVTEYDLAKIDFDDDENPIMNGVIVTLPFLANYDPKTPSPLIDTKEKLFK